MKESMTLASRFDAAAQALRAGAAAEALQALDGIEEGTLAPASRIRRTCCRRSPSSRSSSPP